MRPCAPSPRSFGLKLLAEGLVHYQLRRRRRTGRRPNANARSTAVESRFTQLLPSFTQRVYSLLSFTRLYCNELLRKEYTLRVYALLSFAQLYSTELCCTRKGRRPNANARSTARVTLTSDSQE
jgi:hypothetical protein